MFIYRLVVDFVSVVLLIFYSLLFGQLTFLRIRWSNVFNYIVVLQPMRMLVHFVRALVYWRVGEHDFAITQMLGVVSVLEDKAESARRKRVLLALYGIVAKMYLHCGYLEEVALLLIRANRIMQVKYLPSLPEMDVNSAHLIRAGLVAGKFLRNSKRHAPRSTSSSATGKVIPFPKDQGHYS